MSKMENEPALYSMDGMFGNTRFEHSLVRLNIINSTVVELSELLGRRQDATHFLYLIPCVSF